MTKKLFISIFLFFTLLPLPAVAASEDLSNIGIAQTQNVIDKEAIDGDIVSLTSEPKQLIRAQKAYDDRMFGVIIKQPLLVFRTADADVPVLRNGETLVNVTTINGPIKPGSYITSSIIPGKGQLATDPTGAILGLSLEEFNEKSGEIIDYNGKKITSGKVKIALGIQTPTALRSKGGIFGVLEAITFNLLRNMQQQSGSDRMIRYVIAGLVATLTIVVNFHYFGKNITHGIESVGRNPLARTSIQSIILLNIILIAATSIGGVILSLAIISF